MDTSDRNILDQIDKTQRLVRFMHFPQQGCARRIMTVGLFKYLARNVISADVSWSWCKFQYPKPRRRC